MNLVEIERAKYTELWRDVPEYKAVSFGLNNVDRFMTIMKPDVGETLIDLACGTGTSGLEFKRRGLEVTWLDITDAGLDPQVQEERFHCSSLWDNWPNQWKHGFDYGYASDIMEHIPPEYVMLTIDRIMSSCRVAWFYICLVPDQFGATIGQPLHLTVQPFTWWRDRLREVSDAIEARDMVNHGLYICEQK